MIAGRGREYPLPDAAVWIAVYRWRLSARQDVAWLDLDEAHCEYTLRELQHGMASPQRPQYDADGHRLIREDELIPHFHAAVDLEYNEEIDASSLDAEPFD